MAFTPVDYIASYFGWNQFTPALPNFYWDVYSAEERVKKICFELDKLCNYANMLADNINIDHTLIEELQSALANIEHIDELNAKVIALQETADAIETLLENIPDYDEFLELQNDVENVVENLDTKIVWPVQPNPKYGVNGQVLRTNGDGTTRWQEPVTPTDAQAEEYINQWLDDHPEATTTVLDGSITSKKLADKSVSDSKLANIGIPLSLKNYGFVACGSIADVQGGTGAPTTAPFIANTIPTFKHLNGIQINVRTAGTISIGYIESVTASTPRDAVTWVRSIVCDSTGIQDLYFEPFTIPDNALICVTNPITDSLVFNRNTGSPTYKFKYWNESVSKFTLSNNNLGIVFYGYEEVPSIQDNIDNVLDSEPIRQISSKNNVNNGILDNYNLLACGTLASVIDGTARDSYAPYVVNALPATNVINHIKINVVNAGTLSIGYITTNITQETARNSPTWVKTLNIEDTGVQTVYFDDIVIPDNNYICVYDYENDTIQFNYRSGTPIVTFKYWVPQLNRFTESSNNLGIEFYGYNKVPGINDILSDVSIYNNKKLSILGDSISTYAGYIPEGNLTYYPRGTVTSVDNTWWKKLIDALGMQLLVNNSWSGSKVSTVSGNESAGCMSRATALGDNPDVIIVWMGINDFNNEVPLGTYDGSTPIPTTTTTFREAYGIMLDKILTEYQTAEVWVCTLPQCERSGSEGFPEVNGNNVALVEFNKAIIELATAFGVKILDHNKCGLTYQNMPVYNPDNLHPNANGHSLIANNDIQTMDNYIRTRYPIA